jgi:hypothetical protein
MSLKDLKNAAAARQQEPAAPLRPEPAPLLEAASAAPAAPADGRTKMLGARVPLAVHREFQTYLFRAQEQHPDLTTQAAMPALIRLLRDEGVWQKFMSELEQP